MENSLQYKLDGFSLALSPHTTDMATYYALKALSHDTRASTFLYTLRPLLLLGKLDIWQDHDKWMKTDQSR